ncbi:MAG: L,D-transpeptidase/peptidoglycan binding protein [Actinomycetota bacterium]|nr:L,D-transpeptidase/peptidoglycan binding protein [Actinomycetota bacterium]
MIGLLGAGMYVYDHGRREVVAGGVRVGGIPLGGLEAPAARRRLIDRLAASLNQRVSVTYGSRTFSLPARQARRVIDANGLVLQALSRSRSGSIVSRTFRGLFGGHVNVNVPLRERFDHAAVRRFVTRVQEAVDQPAHDATVHPDSSGALAQIPGGDGVSINTRLLRTRVGYALGHPGMSQAIVVPAHDVRPAVTTAQLAVRYPAYIVVNRGTFTLRLYRHLKLSNTYPIAVGMQGLQTPAGLWHIQWRQVNPPWYVPNDSWAGSLAGTVVPPGPSDPLKARFMSFNGGAGIHGIAPSEYGSIGHTASHGCIRMTIPDVIDLYGKVDVGTPVYIL